MKIAICDDDAQERLHISSCLEKYQTTKQMELTYKIFKNAIELIDTIRDGKYDIVFLDILMPGVTGMEAAKEIRSFNSAVKIIFLTSSPEFAVESYLVNAYYYLIKPATDEKLFPILDQLACDIQKPVEGVIIQTQTGIVRIPFSRIEYIEVLSKTVFFHLTDGSVKKVYGSLKDFEETLSHRDEFVKTHRSYIVNMQWIRELSPKEIVTECNHKIPISRLLYAPVREAYMKYLFIEKDVK